jgi:hypothetical protein
MRCTRCPTPGRSSPASTCTPASWVHRHVGTAERVLPAVPAGPAGPSRPRRRGSVRALRTRHGRPPRRPGWTPPVARWMWNIGGIAGKRITTGMGHPRRGTRVHRQSGPPQRQVRVSPSPWLRSWPLTQMPTSPAPRCHLAAADGARVPPRQPVNKAPADVPAGPWAYPRDRARGPLGPCHPHPTPYVTKSGRMVGVGPSPNTRPIHAQRQ